MSNSVLQTISVDLGERSYPIHIGDGLLGPRLMQIVGEFRSRQVAIFTNPTVSSLYLETVLMGLTDLKVDVFTMSDGEAHKNLDTYNDAIDFLMSHRHNRTTCLVALGGGVVGDLTGFVAATFQRGVDFIQIPTTLLAQVDSSVGGKTAVNHPSGKNMIGAFYQPQSVVIDTSVLYSLPEREYAAGLAEVVKYGVIYDADFFAWLETNSAALLARQTDALVHVIRRSCEIKAEIVAQDEREAGLRAILNFGHTFGHAVENLSGYGTWLHGEAVSVGMVMAAQFSERLNHLPQDAVGRIADLLVSLGLPVTLSGDVDAQAMLVAMGMDKKTVDGHLRFIVVDAIGQVGLVSDYDQAALDDTLAAFCSS